MSEQLGLEFDAAAFSSATYILPPSQCMQKQMKCEDQVLREIDEPVPEPGPEPQSEPEPVSLPEAREVLPSEQRRLLLQKVTSSPSKCQMQSSQHGWLHKAVMSLVLMTAFLASDFNPGTWDASSSTSATVQIDEMDEFDEKHEADLLSTIFEPVAAPLPEVSTVSEPAALMLSIPTASEEVFTPELGDTLEVPVAPVDEPPTNEEGVTSKILTVVP